MPDVLTPNLGLTKPEVGGSDDMWGEKLNGNFDILDSAVGSGGATVAYVDAQDNLRVLKAGDTMTGDLKITKTSSEAALTLNAPDGAFRASLRGERNGSLRWRIVMPSAAPDGVGNTGSDFAIQSWDNNGVQIGNPILIDRSTGLITITGDPTANLHIAPKQYVDAQVATRAPLASPAFTGNPTAPTPTAGDNDTSLATTAFVQTAVTNGVAGKANIASPTFTGDPKAPTPAPGDNDTSIATTAFVQAAVSAGGGFTFEDAQDAVGTILVDSASIDFTYDDATPSITATLKSGVAEPPIAAGTTAQYWRGDKSWQTLDKAAVGLSNVDNTSDANKPVSTAQAAADALRVLKSGDTMTGQLTLPTRIAGGAFAARQDYVDSVGAALDTAKVAKAGDTMTGNLTLNLASPVLVLNKGTADVNEATIIAYRNSVPRWGIIMAQGAAETGSNAGSNWLLTRYSDAGVYLGAPIVVYRADGLVALSNSLDVAATATVRGGITNCYGFGGDNTKGALYLNSSATRYLFNDGSNYQMPGQPVVAGNGRLWGAGDAHPTVLRFSAYTSGSGTHTTIAGCKMMRVIVQGGGQGGYPSGTTATNPGSGGNSSFGSLAGNGGPSGGASGGDISITGGGINYASFSAAGSGESGANGRDSPIGIGGNGVGYGNSGVVGTGYGSGGGGGGINNSNYLPGHGGGSGGYAEKWIASPAASYSYAVGAAGTAGTSTNQFHGGPGAPGVVLVWEFG